MKIYVQEEGIFISGKMKEIRYLLSSYARKYRTLKELITVNLN
jgi:hypothetical protein